MDIEVIVVPLLVVLILSLLGLSRNRLQRRLGRDISVKPIYLRSHNLSEGLLKLEISNDSGHEVKINFIGLSEVNGKEALQIGVPNPFEIEDRGYESQIIKFRGELQDGKNNCRVTLALQDFKGRRGMEKRFSVALNRD